MSSEIKFIRKRNGALVSFEIAKIKNAIFKALKAVERENKEKALKLSQEVLEIIKKKNTDSYPEVEKTQDIVEKILFKNNEYDAAKAFILYRQQHGNIRDKKKSILNVIDTLDSYVKKNDWRVKENSNSGYSFSGLLLHAAGTMVANYTLNNVYPKEIAFSHKHGDMHIHDLSMGIAGYCAGWSLRELLLKGFGGVDGKVSARAPKHLSSALGQMVNFLGTAQNEWAGAQAFSSFDTYLAPFIYYDSLSYKEVKQNIQTFIFNLNVASRWGGQTPFTNLTFDWVVPEDIANQPVIIGGEFKDKLYKDFKLEMDIINKAFLEIMSVGDNNGRIFTFPIPTYNITKDFDFENDNANLLFSITAKYGIPYFQNFVNSSLKPTDVRSMCCRLRLDIRELKNKTGGLFGSGEKTGSIGVVTINLPRIGYLSTNKEDFFRRLNNIMVLAKESLEIKRKIVQKNMDNGLFPYSKEYLGSLENHFSTIGLIGMNEAMRNYFSNEEDIISTKGRNFAEEILDFMRERLKDYQEETGNIYNLEATPAEGTSYRLAKIDKEFLKGIITAGEEEPYYTNSSLLPVGYTEDLFEALMHQDDLQTKYTGGTVMHIFLGEKIDNVEVTKKLVKKVSSNFKLPYFTISPTFSICKEHGYHKGEIHKCPTCGRETEIYSRIVGYYRPLKNWNKGKTEEFSGRKTYNITKDKVNKKVVMQEVVK